MGESKRRVAAGAPGPAGPRRTKPSAAPTGTSTGAPSRAPSAGRAPHPANGAAPAAPPKRPANAPKRTGLGAPRPSPKDKPVFSVDQAESLVPEETRLYKWAPRCRCCGHPISGTVEVIAPMEGPDRGGFNMSTPHIFCPYCRTENHIGPMTSWMVVAGPLPVHR